MHQRRFEQLPAKRQREILQLAAQEFGKNGFQATSYNRLLERVGIGKSSAYYYFEGKQDLFLTIVARCYQDFFARISEVPAPRDSEQFWRYVAELNRRGLDFMRQEPTAAAVLKAFAIERSQLDLLQSTELLASLEGSYAQLLQLGQSLGAVRSDLPTELMLGVSTALSAACDQWFIQHAAGATGAQLGRIARTFADLARRLLEPRLAERKPSKKTSRQRPPAARG